MTTSTAERISITGPVSQALNWTGELLFRPFLPEKWLVLGFCAWLAGLGEGLGGPVANWNLPWRDTGRDLDDAADWALEHVVLLAVIVGAVAVLGFALMLFLTWLSSRGKFMFLDGVRRNRAAVVEPWQRFKDRANSLFFFRIALALSTLCVFGCLALLAGASYWATRSALGDGPALPLVLFLVFWLGLSLLVMIGVGLITLATNDFIVPIMWQRDCGVLAAWSMFRAELRGREGVLLLYVLTKILIAGIIVVISVITTCVTCCLAALPYLGTVLLLPLFVFTRSYSLYFFSQFGAEWASLAAAAEPATATPP